MRFAGEATRWLGIWLDASLNLEENRRRRIGKTRQAEAKLRRIVNQYGVPPASARNLQAAIVQGTMLYASELTWNGQDKVEGPYQLDINRMARATLGSISQRRGASSWRRAASRSQEPCSTIDGPASHSGSTLGPKGARARRGFRRESRHSPLA